MTYKQKVKITLAIVLPLVILSLIWGGLVGFVKYRSYDALTQDGKGEPAILGTSSSDFRKLGMNPMRVEPFEDGLRTDHSPGQYEWWYFDAHFEDNSKVVVVFFTKDYMKSNTEMIPAVSIAYTSPEGIEIKEEREFNPSEVFFDTSKCLVTMGENSCRVEDAIYKIKAFTETLSVDLSLTKEINSWRPGTGHIHFGDKQEDYFAWIPAVPAGNMQGTVSINEKNILVTGSGYHDHNWGNCSVAGLLKQWWWARIQCGDYTVIAVMMQSKNKYGAIEIPVFLVADSESIIADSSLPGASVTIKETRQATLPGTHYSGQIAEEIVYEYKYKDTIVNITIANRDVLTSSSLLKSAGYSLFKRTLAKSAGINPWYTRFYSYAELSIQQGDASFKAKGFGTQEKMEFE